MKINVIGCNAEPICLTNVYNDAGLLTQFDTKEIHVKTKSHGVMCNACGIHCTASLIFDGLNCFAFFVALLSETSL